MEPQFFNLLETMSEKIDAILVQTTKTNGRVDALTETVNNDHDPIIKKLVAESNENKGKSKMIWIFLSAVGAVALVLIGYYLNKHQ